MKHLGISFLFDPDQTQKNREKKGLLFKGPRLWIFGHDIMQRLDADVDDAAEFVLDHAENTQGASNPF